MEKALEQLSDGVYLVPWGRAQAKQNCKKSGLFSITLALTGCSEASGHIYHEIKQTNSYMMLYFHPSRYSPGIWDKEDIRQKRLSEKLQSRIRNTSLNSRCIFIWKKKMFFLALSIVKAQKQWPTQPSELAGTQTVVLKHRFPWRATRAPQGSADSRPGAEHAQVRLEHPFVAQGRPKRTWPEALACEAGRTGSLMRVKTIPEWITL